MIDSRVSGRNSPRGNFQVKETETLEILKRREKEDTQSGRKRNA